eukprot:Pgem_evm1s13486
MTPSEFVLKIPSEIHDHEDVYCDPDLPQTVFKHVIENSDEENAYMSMDGQELVPVSKLENEQRQPQPQPRRQSQRQRQRQRQRQHQETMRTEQDVYWNGSYSSDTNNVVNK